MKVLLVLVAAAFLYGLTGCASVHPVSTSAGKNANAGRVVAKEALSQQGAPYRYGGNSPSEGFDCSGLVAWAHRQAMLDVPRTSAAQFRSGQAVSKQKLQPGDVVFFRINGSKPSHSGVYTGDGKFVHAPSSGRKVRVNSMDEKYWSLRFLGARRYW